MYYTAHLDNPAPPSKPPVVGLAFAGGEDSDLAERISALTCEQAKAVVSYMKNAHGF